MKFIIEILINNIQKYLKYINSLLLNKFKKYKLINVYLITSSQFFYLPASGNTNFRDDDILDVIGVGGGGNGTSTGGGGGGGLIHFRISSLSKFYYINFIIGASGGDTIIYTFKVGDDHGYNFVARGGNSSSGGGFDFTSNNWISGESYASIIKENLPILLIEGVKGGNPTQGCDTLINLLDRRYNFYVMGGGDSLSGGASPLGKGGAGYVFTPGGGSSNGLSGEFPGGGGGKNASGAPGAALIFHYRKL
jgi:hypothetical protein